MSVEVEALAARAEGAAKFPVTKKRMFGGIALFLNGNMLCCASRKGLMVRVGKEGEAKALESPYAAPCMGTGRRMPGFVMVAPEGVAADRDLKQWIRMAHGYVSELPPK